MANGIPTDPPVIRKQDWGAVVREAWGDEWMKHEKVYALGKSARSFESSDYGTSGLYGVLPTITYTGTSSTASTWAINLGTAANGDADDYRNKAITMVYAIGTGTAVGTATNTVGDFNIFTRAARFTAQQSDTMAVIGGTRTNLFLQSEDFNSALWSLKSNVAIGTNAVAAPDGSTTADSLTDDSTDGPHREFRAFTFPTAGPHTISCFARRSTHTWFQLAGNDSTTTFFANFNLATGVVGTTGNSASTITAHADGWYRCTMTTETKAATGNLQVAMLDSDSAEAVPSYVGTATVLYLWGMQVESSASASNYIPTTSVAVTDTTDEMTYSIA